MILLLVITGNSGNTSKLGEKNLLEFQPYLLIINLYLTPKEKQSLLANNVNQSLPEKTYQMCLLWRWSLVSSLCPPFHLMSMGSKTCCLTLILIKSMDLMICTQMLFNQNCSYIRSYLQAITEHRKITIWLVDCRYQPCFQKVNLSTPSNYRPISLIASCCCKVMEHIIFYSIMDHIKINNILISNQHGFRPGFCCQTKLISLMMTSHMHWIIITKLI